MGVKRAMVVLEAQSAIPEDRVINTFHFSPGSDALAIATKLIEFYNTGLGTFNPVAYWISPYVSRTANKCEIRVYDLADPKPRPPSVHQFTLGAANSAQLLPRELSVCLSYYSERNIRRQRGRIYIGPLSVNAMENRVGDQGVVVALRDSLAGAGSRLAQATPGADWVVYSELEASSVGPEYAGRSVSHGWVDNAFDIQRRRGVDPSVRSEWASL
jgi:hypothetical protein